jgi:hypothetical protein
MTTTELIAALDEAVEGLEETASEDMMHDAELMYAAESCRMASDALKGLKHFFN